MHNIQLAKEYTLVQPLGILMTKITVNIFKGRDLPWKETCCHDFVFL